MPRPPKEDLTDISSDLVTSMHTHARILPSVHTALKVRMRQCMPSAKAFRTWEEKMLRAQEWMVDGSVAGYKYTVPKPGGKGKVMPLPGKT